jgi:cytochrome c-type biogenesis protein CcmE
MKGKQSQKPLYITAFLLLAGGLAYLVASGFQQSSMYFLNVSEALAKGPEKVGQARLFGRVLPEGLQRSRKETGVRFSLADKSNTAHTIRVDYDGAVPDNFEPGAEVIVEGTMHTSPAPHFEARKLMTKCPSKYEKSGSSWD